MGNTVTVRQYVQMFTIWLQFLKAVDFDMKKCYNKYNIKEIIKDRKNG